MQIYKYLYVYIFSCVILEYLLRIQQDLSSEKIVRFIKERFLKKYNLIVLEFNPN